MSESFYRIVRQIMRPRSRKLLAENHEAGDRLRNLVDKVIQTSSTKLLHYKPLVASIRDGNWKDAHQFLNSDRKALTAKITKEGETALHLAVKLNNSDDFIKNLIEMMSSQIESLGIVDKDGQTALSLSVENGNIEVVKFLIEKKPDLPYIRCKNGNSPLQIAAEKGNKEMVSFLLLATEDHTGHSPYGGKDGQLLLKTLLAKKLYGSVSVVLDRHPKLINKKNQEIIFPLKFIAEQPSAFFSGCSLSLLQRLLYLCAPAAEVLIFQSTEERTRNQNKVSMELYINSWTFLCKQVPYIMGIQEMKLMHKEAEKLVEWACKKFSRVDYEKVEETFKGSLISAVKLGIEEIVKQMLDCFPFSIDDQILKCVVSNRQAYILKLKNHVSRFKQMAIDYKDNDGNNILHLAAEFELSNRNNDNRSAVFQLLYELQWFKEMGKLVPPSYRAMKNNKGKTNEMIFVKAHENLLEEGERWLKETATRCIAVSTITGTFAFAAAGFLTIKSITEGLYIFRRKAVMLFCFADALSLISSCISVLMFVVILMSRYTWKDFHRALPQRVVMGIASLTLSIFSLIVASTAIGYGVLMILVIAAGVAYLVFCMH